MNESKYKSWFQGHIPRNPAVAVLYGTLAAMAVGWLLKRKAAAVEAGGGENSNTSGSVPHTDFDAAAAIGRQTGGEVFDD